MREIKFVKNKCSLLMVLFSLLYKPCFIYATDDKIIQSKALQNIEQAHVTSDSKEIVSHINVLDAVSKQIYKDDSTYKKAILERSKWLENAPSDDYELSQYYNKYILRILRNNDDYNKVTNLMIDSNQTLTEKDKMLLMVLCLEIYSEKQNIKLDLRYSDQHKEDIITKDFCDYFLKHISHIYEIEPKKLLFLWGNGSGAHNCTYWIWLISFEGEIFDAKLLEVPNHKIASKYNTGQSFLGVFDNYDKEKQLLVFDIETMDQKNQSKKVKKFYKFSEDKLVLNR